MKLLLAAALAALQLPTAAALAAPLAGRAAAPPDGGLPRILPARERARLRDRWLLERLETVVPELMRREGVDLWVLVSREYNEDPVFASMAPATWLRARRRTILVFHDPGAPAPVERLAVARYSVGELFEGVWDKDAEPDQWRALGELVRDRDPERIAIDVSPTFALADGLSASERDALLACLTPEHRGRVVSGERLALGWLETRIDEELEVYPSLCRIAHRIIAEGLSDRVVQPGHTTTDDVEWWYRDRILELRLDTWFHPSVSVQRAGDPDGELSFASRPDETVIRRGDLVHVDFGIRYLGLNTDTQQHAYVLQRGETEAPAGLRDALAAGNRLQDVLTSNFVRGRTGNEILAETLAEARAAGLDPTVYTHPLGFHGHGAGPTIGLWDQQDGVPGRGDYPLFPRTVHSIELAHTARIPEWGGAELRIMLEEDAYFDGETVRYLDGRQTELILIP